jgi:cytochrome c
MKDPLFGNKIAGALLAALLLFFGLPQLAGALFGGGHGGHGEVHIAYPVEFEFGGAEPAKAKTVDLATLLASATPAAGARRAALCKSCHTFEKGGANSTGPNLWGVVNRPVASHEGFKYSAALKDFGGEWTYERLDHFIENSQGYIPGTAMVQRFAKPEQRAEILAYLQTLSDDPVPLPEPPPPSEPAAEGAPDESAAAAPETPAPDANATAPAPPTDDSGQ